MTTEAEERIKALNPDQKEYLFWYMVGALQSCNREALESGLERAEHDDPYTT